MKPTQTALNKYLGKGHTFMHDMRKDRPKQYEILMLGWQEYCKQQAAKNENS